VISIGIVIAKLGFVERFYRSHTSTRLFVLFIITFLGAVARADQELVSLIRDVRLAQEANDINTNKWNEEVAKINDEGLSKVEALLSKTESPFEK